MAESTVLFTILTNSLSSNSIPHIVVPFLLVPLHQQGKCQERDRNRGQTATNTFQSQRKYKIECYPKTLLIFTAYQLQGWWTMILSPVKAQTDGINVTKYLPKRSWHIHLKHSKPYIFIF